MVTARFQTKKEEILNAGMDLIWRNGYNGTSVKDIVQSAGIPKGSFYQYFESKEDFCKEALFSMCEYGRSLTEPILKDDKLSPLQKIRKIYEVRIQITKDDFHFERGCMMTNLTGEVANNSEVLRTLIKDTWARMIQPLIETIQAAIDKGEISSDHDATELSEYLENAFRGAITATLSSRDAAPFDAFMKYTFNRVLV